MRKKMMLFLVMAVLVTAMVGRLGGEAAAEGMQAGRPTPGPTAYPQPGQEFQSEAYPPPVITPTPGAIPGPDLTADDPRPGVPYFWGLFKVEDHWRGYVTIDLGYPDFEMQGFVSLISDSYRTVDLVLYPQGYNGTLGRTTYVTERMLECGEWSGQMVILDGLQGDIRFPNDYWVWCIYLPMWRIG